VQLIVWFSNKSTTASSNVTVVMVGGNMLRHVRNCLSYCYY